MFNAVIEKCNAFAQSWASWVGRSIVDAAIVLAIVSLMWWALRRKAPPQLGYLLFLLVPVKLFIPLYVSIPDRYFSWAPRMAAGSIGHDATATAPPLDVLPGERDMMFPRERASDLPARAEFKSAGGDRGASPKGNFEQPAPLNVARRAAPSLFAWLMFAWAFGIFALLVRLTLAQIRFHRGILRDAKSANPIELPVDFAGLLNRMRVGRKIRIVESDRLSSPVVWGMFRPVLILPAGFAASMSAKRLEWVLLHELAHVKRRDLIVNCFQRAAGILHFINPSIWIANRAINRLREYACDDMASAYGDVSRVESGEAFLSVMRYAAAREHRGETPLEGALGMFELSGRASCFTRMKRLLDTNRRLSVKIRWGSLCLLLLTAALALPQMRAAAPQGAVKSENPPAKAVVKNEEKKPASTVPSVADMKLKAENDLKSAFRFSVVIARHVMLLDGKEIVTWPQIEEKIAKRPNPALTQPSFYFTHGAIEAGKYNAGKAEIWRLHRDYKLVGHSEGSLLPRADLRYDGIQSAADLKPDESLRIDGRVVAGHEKPVAGAEIILVTAVGSSLPYKDYDIALVAGRVRDRLDEVLALSDEKGRFAIYPPKDQEYSLIALHPDVGICFLEKYQFAGNHVVRLLKWSGLTTRFGEAAEKQEADLHTTINRTERHPQITLCQYWSDLNKDQAVPLFGFSHVPPIFSTTISRSFSGKEGVGISLPGASVSLLPGETRRIDLGPLTEQQRQELERMRHDIDERGKKTHSEPAKQVDTKAGQPFALTVLDAEGKPVPQATVEFRIDPKLSAEQVPRGQFIGNRRGSNYGGVLTQTDATGRIDLKMPQAPKSFEILIEIPGHGPFVAEWSSADHPISIPPKFTANLDAGWSVGGVLVDDQGKPIRGAKIRMSIQFKKPPGDTSELYIGTRPVTDAEGKWRFDSVPASVSEFEVEITHPDFKASRLTLSRRQFGIAAAGKPAARIIMQGGLSVVGKVIDEAGKPIAGAVIRTKFVNDKRQAKTNEKGEYRLTGCEPAMARIVVWAKGRATDMKEVRVGPDVEPVNFTMQPGGKVRVRVLDEKGNPAARTRIFFQEWRGPFQYFEFDKVDQYADKNGIWQWNEAPLDEFQADICLPDGMELVERPLKARAEEYVFHGYPPLAIAGKVIDSETKAPIKSFRVIRGLRGYTEWQAKSGKTHIDWIRDESYMAKDGRYRVEFDRESLAHLVRIEADGYLPAVSRDIKSDEGKVQFDFALKKGKDLVATVLTPDGKPAAGAKIALGVAGSQINITNGNIEDRSTKAARQETDASGVFRLPPQNDAFQLVITHSAGYYSLKSAEKEVPSRIVLTPWARVAGTFRVGPRTMPSARIIINCGGIASYGEGAPHISTDHKATTGPDGKFSFERVFPGQGRIGREMFLTVTDGAREATSSVMISATFTAGETTHVDLGGQGRPVVGKLTPPTGFKEKVLWSFALIDIRTPRLQLPAPAGVEKDTPKYKEWQSAYLAYQQTLAASPYISATVGRDGSFRIDDAPAGDYALSVRFILHPAGHLLDYRFSVPPIEGNQIRQPLDLGELKLEND